MEDLIVLLIFIAWIGYTFYKESKKHKKTVGKPPTLPVDIPEQADKRRINPQMEEFDYDTDFEGGIPVTEAKENVIMASPEVSRAETSSPIQFIPLINQIHRPDFESIEYVRDEQTKIHELMKEQPEDEASKEFSFYLRQAVIYSCILHRPYD